VAISFKDELTVIFLLVKNRQKRIQGCVKKAERKKTNIRGENKAYSTSKKKKKLLWKEEKIM
jgi:hypothetical protein